MAEINVEERVARAQEYFLQGYSCCQSVVLAFSDCTGVDCESLKRLTIGLGGGVGRLREVCGTVSGMAVVAGCLADAAGKTEPGASPEAAPRQLVAGQKQATYAIVQELAGRFREENGSIVCRELLGLRTDAAKSPVPQERNAAYYRARPCKALVGCSARIIAEYIQKNC